MSRVFIGVGHGGSDPGACAGGLRESDVNLVMALAMKAELERHGVEVGISRTTDVNDTTTQKVAQCNAFCADLAVDCHNNSGGGKGFEVYQQQSSSHQAKSWKLAICIEARVKEMGQISRGLKGEKSPSGGYTFGFLSGCKCPAVLCEGAFLDNAEDVKMINTKAKQQEIGVAYARGVLDYLELAVLDQKGDASVGFLTAICGKSVATAEQMRAYLKSVNPDAHDYADIYIEEGQMEGIRGDIAFAQSCLETGNFKFGGDVKENQYNFCGLGATGGGEPGCSFPTPREGIRAQIQHLKAYATKEELKQGCIDPRFNYFEHGVAPYVEWLGQQENPSGAGWATGQGYGAKILAIHDKIMEMPVSSQGQDDVLEALRAENKQLREENARLNAMKASIHDLVS